MQLVEKICYACLSIASLTAAGVLVHREFFGAVQSRSIAEEQKDLQKGSIALGVPLYSQNVILAVSTTCHFCDESIPFYKELSKDRLVSPNRFKLIVVAPQSEALIHEHLDPAGLAADAFLSRPLSTMRITGTPTLLISDRRGFVKRAFIGKLSKEQETEVLQALERRN